MLNQANNVFIVGIKGVAMANLAVILNKMGKTVSGSDVREEFITDELLKKNKITWQVGFDPKKLPLNANLVIYSAVHQGDKNPQIIEAIKRGIKVISQAEFLGQLSKQFKTIIAVCGCHGKTTTSSLFSYALIKLGAKPSYMIGSSSFNTYFGGDFNGTDYFVIEADEYGVNPPQNKTAKFHYLNPDFILCTNIDFDHPDVYKDLAEVKEAYLKFFDNKKLILCADDPPTLQSINRLRQNQFLTYGFSRNADLRIINLKIHKNYSLFDIIYKPVRHAGRSEATDSILKDSIAPFSRSRMTIKLYGEKNISNAAGVILTLLKLGFDAIQIKRAIKDFTGPKRRFEKVYFKDNTFLFDDYAHHPNEIKATISAARNRFPNRRIVIIFQPHTYSRTQALLEDFGESLSLADKVFILPIFASARENPKNFNITSRDIEKVSRKKNIKAVISKKELIQLLTTILKTQDIVFTMGAGDVYKLKDDIIEIISSI